MKDRQRILQLIVVVFLTSICIGFCTAAIKDGCGKFFAGAFETVSFFALLLYLAFRNDIIQI